LKAALVFGSAFLSFDLFIAKRRASVLVDSFAEENYPNSKETDEGLVPETYQLVQGKKIGGYISHKSLSDVPFIEVAENSAEQLRSRDCYPTQAKEEGDLLIIVNWGVTHIQADFDELFPTDVEEETGEEGEASDSLLDGVPGSALEEGEYITLSKVTRHLLDLIEP
jgi:hypothetical protein